MRSDRDRTTCLRLVGGSAPLILAGLLSTGGASAQQTGTVTGVVSDRATGQPLESALVRVEGQEGGVLTNQNGLYLMQAVPAGTPSSSSQVRSTASCSRQGIAREVALCIAGLGIPALRGLRMGRRAFKAIKDGLDVLDALSMALGSFFCHEIYESYEAYERCTQNRRC